MSPVQNWKLGVAAAGLSCLMLAGYAQAQNQADDHTKPVQYADQDTGEPLNADQTHQNQTHRADRNQNAGQGQRNTTYFRGSDAAGSNDQIASAAVNHYVANCLLIKNRGEIELNRFAQERAQNEQVKQFAQQMIQDHSQLEQKLERIAQSDRGPGQNAAVTQLLELDRQIADECGQMVRSKLEEAPQDEFDKCFVGQQVGAHIQMLSALKVISQQTSGELAQIAQDAEKKVQQHLDHAEKLMKELDSSDTRQARANR